MVVVDVVVEQAGLESCALESAAATVAGAVVMPLPLGNIAELVVALLL